MKRIKDYLWYRKVYRIPLRKSLLCPLGYKSYRGAIFLICLFGAGFMLCALARAESDIEPAEYEDIIWSEYHQETTGAAAEEPVTQEPEVIILEEPEDSAESQDPKERLKEITTVSFTETDLKQVLSILADSYDLNIVAGDEVKGAITINLKDVPLGDVLTQALKLRNFGYKWDGNIIKIVSLEEESETRIFPLSHISLDLASEVVANQLSEDGSVKMNSYTNELIITDTIAKLEEIKELLDKVDGRPAQVRIEAKLIDITHTDLNNLGISWTGSNLNVKIPKALGGRPKLEPKTRWTSATQSTAGTSSTLTGSQLILGFTQASATVSATIDALVQRQRARVIATPIITTLNNTEASINIGEKYPIREQTQTSTGTLETTRFVDIGTILKVTPKINKDGTVQMYLHPEVSSFSAEITAGPRITTREASTTVIVRDGETVIIAGLLKTDDSRTKSRIPILGSLPLIGGLFRSQDKNLQQKELIIMITPYILKSDKNADASEKEPVSLTKLTTERLNAMELFDKAEDLEKGVTVQYKAFPRELRLNEAAKNYERISIIYPNNYYAEIGLFRAGCIYEKRLKDYEAAISVYEKLLADYSESSYAEKASERIKRLKKKVNKAR